MGGGGHPAPPHPFILQICVLVEDFERDIGLTLLNVCMPVRFTISESFLKI